MDGSVFKSAGWICTEEFSQLSPVELLHKETENSHSKPECRYRNVHVLFRKIINIKSPCDSCILRITADDYYKLYINGIFVCQGPAQGYYFNYYWNQIDISRYLQIGENVISAEVFYHGLINRAYNSGDNRMGMIAEAYLGDSCVFKTDASWEYATLNAFSSSHMLGYDTLFAEDFDSRQTPSEWHGACEKQTDYTFSADFAKTVQVYERAPAFEERLSGGGRFYDFGQELTATLHIVAAGKSGARIRILCGEETDDSAEKVRYEMRCNCNSEEYWTLADGECELKQYDYKAFRYVTLIPDDGVTIKSLAAVVRHYPFDDAYCTLQSDNEILCRVWNICKNGVKYGAQEVFVDCPLREKGQYAGDLTVTSGSHIVLTGDWSLLKKAIDNQMQSAVVCKGLMAVTPGSYMQEIADYSLQFPILALRYYEYSGDKEYLLENLKVCEGIVRHFSSFARPDGLLEDVTDKWNLVDWPVECRDDYDFDLSQPVGKGCHNVINAFYIGCVLQTEQIREIFSVSAPIQSDSLIRAFQNTFFNTDTRLYRDADGSQHSSLHANVLPLFYNFAAEENKNRIADFICEKGLCCGTYFAYFLLKALCNAGRYMDAFNLIVSTGEHSWYNMVREGATTCFEAWGKEQKWNTSLCHPWSSAPISILANDILPRYPQLGKIITRNR